MSTSFLDKLQRYNPNALLALVVVVSATLRLILITSEGFWFDEFCIWRQAHMSLPELYDDLVRSDVHPPLYQLIILAWSAFFGTSELSLRMPSVLFGVLTVIVVYDIGRRLFDVPTGLIAALFIGLGRDAIYYSQEARSYSLLLLLAAATFWAWLRLLEDSSRHRLIIYGGLGLLLAYTHAFGLLFLIFLALAYALIWKRGDHGAFRPRAWWTVHVAMGLLFLPWLPALYQQTTRIQGDFWIAEPKPWFFVEYLFDYMGHTLLVVGIVLLAAIAFYDRRKRPIDDTATPPDFPLRETPLLVLMLAWIVFMFWVPYLISILSQPMMHSKSALMVIVPLSLLAARGLLALGAYRMHVLVLWTAISLYAIISTVYLKQNREQWKDMADEVSERYRPGHDLAILYHPDYDYFYCYRYYLDKRVDAFELLCKGDACKDAIQPIEARADSFQIDRLWLLKIRASDAFPKGLDTRWRITEEHPYHNGTLQLLERR